MLHQGSGTGKRGIIPGSENPCTGFYLVIKNEDRDDEK